MTKRRPCNKKPSGVNASLGNCLSNERAKAHVKHIRTKYGAPGNETVAFLSPPKDAAKVINSVTEETGLEEFLAKAELAGTEFAAERGEFRFADENTTSIVPTVKDILASAELQKQYADRLRIPRRPARELWETADELQALEKQGFLQWRKDMAELQEVNGLTLTPFERNLELWRQLWRVVERSDIVVQILDARNPLLFRNTDLEAYVKECDVSKQNILLINKADLLTDEQIRLWQEWIVAEGIDAVFWSAIEPEVQKPHEEELPQSSESEVEETGETSNGVGGTALGNALFLRNSQDLIALLKSKGHCNCLEIGARPLVVGMVGYPNVGKSSTINRILGEKKVSVSATPGKTRHLQTVIVDDELTLCDCPGLVMPSFAFNRSEMLLNAILPVDQMHDHFAPITLLTSRVPRRYFESIYSIMLPKPAEHEPREKPPTAHELLTSIAFMRGFMCASGIPDCSRASRLVIKDVIGGKLKWVSAPPNVDQAKFDEMTYADIYKEGTKVSRDGKGAVVLQQLEKRHLLEGSEFADKVFDCQFFSLEHGAAHIKNVRAIPNFRGGGDVTVDPHLNGGGKKHHNKGKKEKLRRIYADLNI